MKIYVDELLLYNDDCLFFDNRTGDCGLLCCHCTNTLEQPEDCPLIVHN